MLIDQHCRSTLTLLHVLLLLLLLLLKKKKSHNSSSEVLLFLAEDFLVSEMFTFDIFEIERVIYRF